jgi:apolipoprotein D and lipocalin family protein
MYTASNDDPASLRTGLTVCVALLLSSCAVNPVGIPRVEDVELERFMGDWYVIAHIPSWPERDAYNAVESYNLAPDGSVSTVFQFRRGGFDAKLKTMRPVGYVQAGTGNAVWGMQFVWPIKAEYVIVYVDPQYQQTIIGRSSRDYAWIMARSPTMADADYARLCERLQTLGYSLEQLRRVPQQWPETADERRATP